MSCPVHQHNYGFVLQLEMFWFAAGFVSKFKEAIYVPKIWIHFLIAEIEFLHL